MKELITNLIRTQEKIDGLSIAIAVDVYDYFAQGITKIELDDIAERYGVNTLMVSSKMRNLQELGYMTFMKDGKMIAIERGHNFGSFFVGGELLLVERKERKKVEKAPPKSLEDIRLEKIAEWQPIAQEKGMSDKLFQDFINYWTAEQDGKMRFQKTYFLPSARMQTFINNERNRQTTFNIPT
jgi:ABC-type multidrug transport system ATPase subunit